MKTYRNNIHDGINETSFLAQDFESNQVFDLSDIL